MNNKLGKIQFYLSRMAKRSGALEGSHVAAASGSGSKEVVPNNHGYGRSASIKMPIGMRTVPNVMNQGENMTRRCVAIVTCLLVFILSGDGQTIDGFKGYKWGTSLEVMKDRFQLKKDVTSSIQPNRLKGKIIPKANLIQDACWYYTNKSYVDVPTYSMDVEFKFYQDRFCAVRIGTSDDFATVHLLDVWKKAYGEGIKARTYAEQRIEYYSWPAIGKDSQADLKRLVGGWTTSDGKYIAGYGELTYFSKSIDSLQYRNELERGK